MAEPRRVAIIGTRGYPSYYGGFETAVRKLAPYLAEEGWDVTVYGRAGATKVDDPELDARVTTVQTRGFEKKSLSTLSHGLTATWHAIRHKPDVALVMNVANGYWLPLLRLRGVPTLVNTDGIEWDRAKWGRFAKWVFHTGAKMTARFADRLVFDAREIERRWKDEFKRDGAFIPYGGEPVAELPVEAGLARRKYVLVVARFVPENTIPEFFDAVPLIAAKHDVVIVGSSGYGGELDERAKALDEAHENVHWLGHLSDDRRLFALWQHAGAYFHGHSVGGTNPALVQAMATGVPIVARDTVYNREVLADGAAFTQPTPEAISAAIDALIDDAAEQDRIVAVSHERSETIYSWARVNAGYATELEQLADRL